MEVESKIVDGQATDQSGAQAALRAFRDNGFGGDDQQAAKVLGRPASEIRDMVSGDLEIDDDLTMKVRGIADERGIDLK